MRSFVSTSLSIIFIDAITLNASLLLAHQGSGRLSPSSETATNHPFLITGCEAHLQNDGSVPLTAELGGMKETEIDEQFVRLPVGHVMPRSSIVWQGDAVVLWDGLAAGRAHKPVSLLTFMSYGHGQIPVTIFKLNTTTRATEAVAPSLLDERVELL